MSLPELELPDDVKSILPNKRTTVLELLSYNLPPVSHSLSDLPIENVLSNCDPPEHDLASLVALMNIPIPPDPFRQRLANIINQSNEGTYKSLCTLWLPTDVCHAGLWLVEYWNHVEHLRWIQDEWRRFCAWLKDRRTVDGHIAGSYAIYTQAIANVESLAYEQELFSLRGQHEPAFGFASRLFSKRWVDGWILLSIVDAFSIRQNSLEPTMQYERYILPSYIPSGIEGAYNSTVENGDAFKAPKSSKPLKTWIDNGGKMFYFVLNINQNHWVAVQVDIPGRRIQVGDSLRIFRGVRAALKPMLAWLSYTLDEEFTVEFDLVCGEQKDGISCGLFAANTIAFHVFGDQLLTDRDCDIARASYFNKLVDLHLMIINPPPSKSGPANTANHICGANAQLDPGRVEITPGLRFNQADQVRHAEIVFISDSSSESTCGSESDTSVGSLCEDFDAQRPQSLPGGIPLDLSLGRQLSLGCDLLNKPDATKNLQAALKTQPLVPGLDQGQETNHSKTSTGSVDATSQGPSKKRKHIQVQVNDSDTDSPGLENVDHKSSKLATNRQSRQKRLKTKSAIYVNQARKDVEDGTFGVDESKWGRFIKTILKLDPHTKPNPSTPLEVRHSKCGRVIKLEGPYLTRYFKEHCERDTCAKNNVGGRAPSSGAGMKLLTQFGFKSGASGSRSKPVTIVPPDPPVLIMSACRGIQEIDFPGIDGYINRTGFSGGGSNSISSYARSTFRREYHNLTVTEKRSVTAQAYQDQRWRLAHIDGAVYSTKCERLVQHEESRASPPCEKCLALLIDNGFKKAVRRKPKNPKNLKFTNRRFLNIPAGLVLASSKGVAELLNGDPTKTPAAKFVAKILSAPESDRGIFYGLVQALVVLESKQRRGVGLQNFRYDPSYDEFCHTILSLSPSAYQTFRCYLPARTASSFSVQRSRTPNFPLSINSDVFVLAKAYMESVKYSGPLCLACDDTKLLPSLRTYYDSQNKQWYLVGGTNGPVQIADNEELVKVLQSGKVNKATKIWLWVLQIPLPGIPPLAIAALPIASSVPASVLAGYLREILDGLFDAGLNVVSYASDGSAVEQSVQSTVFNSEDNYMDYQVLHPLAQDDFSNLSSSSTNESAYIKFRLRFYRKWPLVMIQDSKHALKTCRNNLFSGARLLVLGSYIAHYSQVREIAFDIKSTLFHRDVEKMDRQDDQAALRLFCAATLKFIILNRPQYLGLVVYLFVLGDLCDAYQSRTMLHSERFKIAIRTRFFLEIWLDFLNEAGYPTSDYFISREAHKILLTVTEGLIQLIYLYRDHVSPPQPLLPWLHSTEACEHMFAELRKLIKDFTYLDAVHSFPKLRVRLHALYSAFKPDATESIPLGGSHQKKASGYQHTYMNNSNLDLPMLCVFPNSAQMDCLASAAHREATILGGIVGMQAYHPSEKSLTPSPATETEHQNDFFEPNQAFKHPVLDEEVSASEALHELVALSESWGFPTDDISTQRDNIIYASSALQVENTMMIHGLPGDTAESNAQEQQQLMDILATSHPPRLVDIPNINEELFSHNIAGPSFDLEVLVAQRETHQTNEARKCFKGFRNQKTEPVGPDNDESKSTKSVNTHLELARAFAQTLRDAEEAQLSDRLNRWRNGDRISGNSANAKQAALKRADMYIATRGAALRRQHIPAHELVNELSHARINSKQLLKANTYVWVMAEDSVQLAQVRCIYSKEGGKYGAHSHVPDIDNLGHISYIGVQLFSQIPRLPYKFRAIHATNAQASVLKFRHVHVDELLMLAPESGLIISAGTGPNDSFIEFTTSSGHLRDYKTLEKYRGSIVEAFKEVAKERRSNGTLSH